MSFVQATAVSTASGGTETLAFPSPLGAGNTILVFQGYDHNDGNSNGAPTDTQLNTYHALFGPTGPLTNSVIIGMGVWAADAQAGANTVKLNDTAGDRGAWMAVEYSGLGAAATLLDQSGQGGQGSGILAYTAGPTSALGSDGDLLLLLACSLGSSGALVTAAPGFTQQAEGFDSDVGTVWLTVLDKAGAVLGATPAAAVTLSTANWFSGGVLLSLKASAPTPPPPSGGIQEVADAKIPGGESGGTSDPIDTTGANLIVMSTSYFETSLAVSDSNNNEWILAESQHDDFGVALFYCLNPIVGPGHTFTTSSGFGAGSVQAFSGVGTFGGAVGNKELDTNNYTTVQPGALAAVTGCLLVAAIGENAEPTDNSVEVDSGFILTAQQPFDSGVNFGNAMAYLIASASGSVNPTFSWDNEASEVMAGMLLFMPAATPPPSGGIAYLGRVRVVGSAPAGNSNPYLGTVVVVDSAPAGDNDPYLGQVTEVGSVPAGKNDPALGSVTVVGSAPAGLPDPFLGTVHNI